MNSNITYYTNFYKRNGFCQWLVTNQTCIENLALVFSFRLKKWCYNIWLRIDENKYYSSINSSYWSDKHNIMDQLILLENSRMIEEKLPMNLSIKR
jgi:hypothetical protein